MASALADSACSENFWENDCGEIYRNIIVVSVGYLLFGLCVLVIFLLKWIFFFKTLTIKFF